MTNLSWPSVFPTLHATTSAGLRITLRAWQLDDADAVYRACQDPDTIRWTTIPQPFLPEHASGFVTTRAAERWESREEALFAVVNGDTDEVLASCGLVRVDDADSVVEIGYWVAPWARRQGVATAAAHALSRWAIAELGAARVVIEAATANEASQRAALGAGFVSEGIQRSKAQRFNERDDMALFSLLPSDL